MAIKMSPLSDTTNLAAMSAETPLYRHIFAMMFTTGPAFIVAFLLFLFIGLGLNTADFDPGLVEEIKSALSSHYRLNPLITLLPLLTLSVMSAKKIAAEVTMSTSVVVAVLIAIVFQQHSVVEVLNALWLNSPTNTGIDSLDALLGRGGISYMSWTLLLALLALALGGILHKAGFLTVLLQSLIAKVKRTGTLVAVTIGSGFTGNLAMGEAYISIILSSQLLRPKYKQLKVEPAVLSRSVEEGATMTTGLIPWTTAGTFYATTLGVPVLEYLPYAFFNYSNGIIAIAMAYIGLGLLSKSDG